MSAVRIYGICLVKNEDDIIGQTLTFASQYCDRIFVLDNGSTDDTWQVVQTLASQNDTIVPFRQIFDHFDNGLRAVVYNAIRRELSEDDWWLILDADEYLAEDPRAVIKTAVDAGADVIDAWQIQFFFTERDAQAWKQGSDRPDLPIFERRRYYTINWQETRLFRNRPERAWDAAVSPASPAWLGRACKRRILNRHYQYRDPQQMEKRLRLRHGHQQFSHVRSTDWESAIRDSRQLIFHKDGDAWRFTPSGLWYFYRRSLSLRVRGVASSLLARWHRRSQRQTEEPRTP